MTAETTFQVGDDAARKLAESASSAGEVRNNDEAAARATPRGVNSWLIVGLRAFYAIILLLALLAQIYVADRIFYDYGKARGWHIPAGAIQAWLAATVIQVVSLVLAITRFVFSERALPDSRPKPRRPTKRLVAIRKWLSERIYRPPI